jgi:soluble lytic murein transglycosylase-like protein
MRLSTLGVSASFSFLLTALPISSGAEIFIYQEKDGTTWFTDHKALSGDFQFIRTYGRPTATKSCSGVTREILSNRAKPHMNWVEHYSELYELDYRLVKSVIEVESCFDAYAVSRVGARGLMQLMPATAKELGVQEPFNARQNIRGGTSYLRKMMNRFDGDIKLALAAYNAGPGAVEKYKGIPPYKETQSYVKRILKKFQAYSADAQISYLSK